MRLALANVVALIAYVGALWVCFAFILGFALNDRAPLGFTYQLNRDSFSFAGIYMMFFGPFALLLTLVYFALLRARRIAIWLLAGAVVMTSLPILGWPDVSDEAQLRLSIMIVWAGVAAALVHHVVFYVLRPHVRREESLAA